MLMQGGNITSGRLKTVGVTGLYWMSWISSFSKITAPSVTARFLPTSNIDSSVVEMRPLWTSSRSKRIPWARLSPPVSSASLSASGLVAAKFAGLIASENWRAMKRRRCLARGSASRASIQSDRKRELMR